jgi:hypothetical protein
MSRFALWSQSRFRIGCSILHKESLIQTGGAQT